MSDHRMPACPCLHCGKVVDAGMNVINERRPGPGDYSICAYCGHLMVFAEDLMLREPTNAEIDAIAGDPVLVRATELVAELKKRNP
jgi:hypothetical protein